MRRTTLVVTLVLVAALAAGCGEDPTPKFSRSGSGTPSVSPTPTAAPRASPPEMPDAAKKHTRVGAVAFARHLVAAVNYATETLDTSLLQNLVNPNCDGCRTVIDAFDRLKEQGGKITGGEWSAPRLRLTRLSVGGDFHPMVVELAVHGAPQVVTDGKGKKQTFEGGVTRTRLVLSPVQDGWIVANWEPM